MYSGACTAGSAHGTLWRMFTRALLLPFACLLVFGQAPTNLPRCKNNPRRFDPSLDEARGSHSKRRSSRSNLQE